MTEALRILGLEKSYRFGRSRVPVLNGVELSLEAGDRVAIVGPSGCGKSTLLHLIAGLDRPEGGEIFVNGQAVTRMAATQLARLRRRELGIVFQFFNLFPSLSVLDNVLLPGVIEREALAPLRRRAEALLERVGLERQGRARANELSGGEMQRVALCRALLQRPSLLLADEPTGNLDSENRQAIYRLIRDLSAEHQTAVLMVTHDPEAAAWVHRVVPMRDGKVVPA